LSPLGLVGSTGLSNFNDFKLSIAIDEFCASSKAFVTRVCASASLALLLPSKD
jgi:hypothetical protein